MDSMEVASQTMQHALNQAMHMRLRLLEERIAALEAAKPTALEFPPIDLGMIPGTGANHPFEAFEYTERS